MLLDLLVSVLAGFLGAIGVGGGAILLLYLSTFKGYTIVEARNINLLFFVPCALTGIFFHAYQHLIHWKDIIALIVFGCCGVLAGFYCNRFLDAVQLKKLFGAFVFVLACFQLKNAFKKDSRK